MKKILNKLICSNLLLTVFFISTVNLTYILSMSQSSGLLSDMNPEVPQSTLKSFIKTKSEQNLIAVLNLLELIKESEPNNFEFAQNLFQAELDKLTSQDFKNVHDFTVKFYKDKLKELEKKLEKTKTDRKKIDNMISQLPNREAALKEITILSQKLKDAQQEINSTSNIINTLSKSNESSNSETDINLLEQENRSLTAQNNQLSKDIANLREQIRQGSNPKNKLGKKK